MLIRDDGKLQSLTVGIDVGSTTSQLAVSEFLAEMVGTRFTIVARRVRHQSRVILTPYLSPSEIAGEELARFFTDEIAEAGIDAHELDGGAVLLTGTALDKGNSRLVGDMLGDLSSRFLSVGAGDALETVLSAHGSGTLAASESDGSRYMLCDIGGGTTKLALCVAGQIRGIRALDVGARLVAWNTDREVIRLEPAGQRIARQAGIHLEVGDVLSPEQERAIAERMAKIVLSGLELSPTTENEAEFVRVDQMPSDATFDAVVFAGGVAEYIYEREPRVFGDLGNALADCLRVAAVEQTRDLGTSIRSTVLGVSQASFELSGNTIFAAPLEVLPCRNVPVVVPGFDLSVDPIDAEEVAGLLRTAVAADGRELGAGIAVSFSWSGSATVDRLTAFGLGILKGAAGLIPEDVPLILLCQEDVGATIGRFVKEELGAGRPVVSVDGMTSSRFDFVDVSEFLGSSGAVTVHVKSLLFPDRELA